MERMLEPGMDSVGCEILVTLKLGVANDIDVDELTIEMLDDGNGRLDKETLGVDICWGDCVVNGG